MATEELDVIDPDISYDQETKQLVREFPREALPFYARDEGQGIPPDATIDFLQQEQISEHLGQGHRLVDVLPLITFPNGRRQARAFMLEQTSRTSREVVYRVAEYLFKVGYWLEREKKITDIVPVIIFVHPTSVSTRIEYRSELRLYGFMDCVACRLGDLDAERELATGNLAAATNVMSMSYAPERKVELCTQAIKLWSDRVEDKTKVRKFGEHIFKCARMDALERVEFFERVSRLEGKGMIRTVFDDLRDEGEARGRAEGEARGRVEGRAEGRAEGLADAVLDLLAAHGVPLSDVEGERIRSCKDVDLLREWHLRAATAKHAADLFTTH